MKDEKIPFDLLEKKALKIKNLYIKALIYRNLSIDGEKYEICYVSELGHKYKMSPENFIQSVNIAVESMPHDLQIMIKKELLEKKNNHNYWYFDTLSRSTFYRHRKKAYRQFVEFFE